MLVQIDPHQITGSQHLGLLLVMVPFPVLLCSIRQSSPAGDTQSGLCSMHTWNCVHILNSVGDEHRNSGCLVDFSLSHAELNTARGGHEESSCPASLPPLPEGAGAAALLGLGSVSIPPAVSQGMKLSEKNQGSPAGDLWSVVGVSWSGYGWM